MITTFLHDGELNIPTSNEEINKLLKEVRNKTHENWQILETEFVAPTIWWNPWLPQASKKYYELYLYVGGMGPWQAINFYRENSKSSINPRADADCIVAFLLGILAGVHNQEMKNAKAN